MKRKGKVIQIIPNNKIDNYMFSSWIRGHMIKTGKDLVVLKNPEYPVGLKGYFLSFKRDRPEDIFPILMDSNSIKEGDILDVECERFTIESMFYIDNSQKST